MRRPLIVAAVVAVLAAAASVGGFTPAPASAEPNGICIVNPSPLPTVAPNNFLQILPACSPTRHLQVDVLSGGGGGAGSAGSVASPGVQGTQAQSVQGVAGGVALPITVSSPIPITAATTIPVSLATSFPLAGTYQSTFPTLTNGQSSAVLLDAQGRLVTAPQAFAVASPIPVTAATTIPVSLPTTQPVSLSQTVPVSAALGSPVYVRMQDGTTNNQDTLGQAVDGSLSTTTNLYTNNYNMLFNGTGWDRQRSDVGTTGVQVMTAGGLLYRNYAGGTSTLLVIKGSAGRLSRIINTNTTAQTATFTCYDNPTAASGTVLYAAVLGAAQIVDVSIPATTGITCIASAATVAGNGINVTYE